MTRRSVFIVAFVLIAGLTTWYGLATVDIPELTFSQAASVNDSKKKVIVVGTIASDQVEDADGDLVFTMKDAGGTASRVQYAGQDPVSVADIKNAYKGKVSVSVSGHSHGDYFHATGMTIH